MMTELMTASRNKRDLARDDARWAAVTRRDRSADGEFFYSVRTTGVYCRPGCASRLAHRENVRFHATREDAEKAGFRPCKRCRPDEAGLEHERAAAVAKACRLIDTAGEAPTLDALARAAGMSRFHFHRVFKAATGVTPQAYINAKRAAKVRAALPRSSSVTEAIYRAGFESSGRFYETAPAVLGMTPSRFRSGGKGEAIRHTVAKCALGSILVAASEKGVCAIFLGDDAKALVRDLERQFPNAQLSAGGKGYERAVAKVVRFVEAPSRGLDLPLDIRGTAFQQRVWQALRQIPPGSTATYTQIADRIGLPKAVRAVATACGSNTLAVAIPCHRVLRKSGGLSGYRWGVARKRELLKREEPS